MSRFLIISSLLGHILTICPPEELLSPCTCHDDSIYCSGNTYLDLANIFRTMRENDTKIQKNFKMFYINNTFIEELVENTFEDFTFDAIKIQYCDNLSRIDENAFSNTNLVTKSIELWVLTKMNTTSSIFNILSKFKNLESIDIQYLNINEIPEHAFKPIIGFQDKLNTIIIRGPRLRKIHDNAFYFLNNLTYVELWDTNIDVISKNTFAFELNSDQNLTIRFRNCKFMSTFNIDRYTFFNSRRHIILDISGNAIPYLDEKAFLTFLLADERNVIITDQLLDCNDCRNVWLRNYRIIDKRINNLTCSNRKLLNDSSNFISCNNFALIK